MNHILLKSAIIVVLCFYITAVCAQNDPDLNRLMQNINEAIREGDCDRAQRNYNAWKGISQKTNNSVEVFIRDCYLHKINKEIDNVKYDEAIRDNNQLDHLMEIINAALLESDCEYAQHNYNEWKAITRKTDNRIEKRISDCYTVLPPLPSPPLSKVRFGIIGGLNLSTQKSNAWYYDDAKSPYLGFQVGMLLEIKLSKTVSLQPELLFVQKGSKGQGYTSDKYFYTDTDVDIPDVLERATMQLNYLEMSINLIFTIPTGNDDYFFVGFGPSISYGISGKLKYNPSKEGITFYLSDDDKEVDVFNGDNNFLNKLDYGFNFLAGYQFKQFFIKAGYNLGMNNIAIYKGEGYAFFKNNYFNFSFGVKF